MPPRKPDYTAADGSAGLLLCGRLYESRHTLSLSGCRRLLCVLIHSLWKPCFPIGSLGAQTNRKLPCCANADKTFAMKQNISENSQKQSFAFQEANFTSVQ